ncbi:hypothetical protein [Pseudaeromonas pectinilytica]
MTQQVAAQAHEIGQVAQAVSEAIKGLGEINTLVEQVKECAAPKPQKMRAINATELLQVATKASATIQHELEALREQGVGCYDEQMDRLLMALNSARATGLKVEQVDR